MRILLGLFDFRKMQPIFIQTLRKGKRHINSIYEGINFLLTRIFSHPTYFSELIVTHQHLKPHQR